MLNKTHNVKGCNKYRQIHFLSKTWASKTELIPYFCGIGQNISSQNPKPQNRPYLPTFKLWYFGILTFTSDYDLFEKNVISKKLGTSSYNHIGQGIQEWTK